MPIVVIGLSHQSSPVEVREKFAFPQGQIPPALQALRESGAAEEAVILSTCNRVEVYAATSLESGQAFDRLQEFLHQQHNSDGDGTKPEGLYELTEPDSVHHLFRVACGMESMVLGETEILGQLKQAYQLALQHQHTGGKLNKAFQRAFNVAKHIRTHTNIQRGNISVAAVAVELAERIFETLKNRTVLVIGAGDTGEKTARALVSRGASQVLVTNRTLEKAQTLAAEFDGRAIPFDGWANEFESVDIVISSTAAPGTILDRAKLAPLMKRRRNRPLLLVDIAVPRDIDPAVNAMDEVYLYDVDDLQGIAGDCRKAREAELERCEAIIRDKAKSVLGARRPPHTSGGQGEPALGT